MTTFPVHYIAVHPPRYERVQLLIRLLAFVVLGMIGLSLGAIYFIAYFALPVYAAGRLASGVEPREYLQKDGDVIVRGLAWFAAIYAWFGLVADRLPVRKPEEIVRVEIEPSGQPRAGSALVRIVTGLPSALVLMLLGVVAWLVWIWSALVVLFSARVGDGSWSFLTGMQRWSVRLLAYQASLVADYPPFTLREQPTELPPARLEPPL